MSTGVSQCPLCAEVYDDSSPCACQPPASEASRDACPHGTHPQERCEKCVLAVALRANTAQPAEPREERLADILPREEHACSTGDCDHSKQSECDETLARDYGMRPEAAREFELFFNSKADNPRIRVASDNAFIKFNEVIHVIEKSAADARYNANEIKWMNIVSGLRRERDALREKLSERKNWPLLVAENARLRAELDGALAKLKASEWARKDNALRTYDGLATRHDRYREALERIAADICSDHATLSTLIAREALGADSIYMPIADAPTAAYEAERDVSGDENKGETK